jgi:multidrug efflux pump subunit AcrA (membrane-fusion protein)
VSGPTGLDQREGSAAAIRRCGGTLSATTGAEAVEACRTRAACRKKSRTDNRYRYEWLRPMKFIAATTGLAIAAAVAASQGAARAAEPDAPAGAIVIAVRATSACFSDQVRVTGYLVPRRVAVVIPEGDGYKITDVLASEGDQVISGQDLVRLNRPESKDPRGNTVPARSMTLHAPVAGLIMASSAMVGAVASPQAGPLFRIIADNEVELQAEVPSLQLPKLKPGATARIAVDEGSERNGRVRLVEAEIDPKNQLGHARISIDKDPSLRVGMFVRATIDASRSCGISVPRAAVIYQTAGTSVQVVKNNKIQTRQVQLGLVSDNDVEITEGISDGDTVVANAGTSLHDGDLVKTNIAEDTDQTQVQ